MQLPFRRRIQLALIALGTVPTAVAVVGWALAVRPAGGPIQRTQAVVDSLAKTGRALVQTVDSTRLSPAERRAFSEHARVLSNALSTIRRQETISTAYSAVLAATILALGALVLYASVRVGGYLARQLSRPIDELVGWTGYIRRDEPVPADEREGGAPEFAALRRALREMAAGLREARARQLEAERLRAFREVARRVAHEMKNPLTPIRFAVRALTRSAGPEQRESLDVLQAESDRLELLAREFTEMGRLPEGPAAEVDLGELVTELVRTAVPPGVPILVEIDGGTPRITGHYEPLRRVFSNLLRNAVEAGPGTGGLALAVAPAEPDGAEVRIIDHGPGVPASMRERLFQPYATGGKDGGTGLGLALVRQTVESHGGQVRHEPTPGGGATFVVTLPRVRTPVD
jgi:two-component system, NtrC family, nitrogen regulation sensor histidine kinase NtrY